MKIIFDEKDKEIIEIINNGIKNNNDPGRMAAFCSDMNERYYIRFEVTDIAKANAFLWEFLRTDEIGSEQIQEEIGIKVLKIAKSGGMDNETKFQIQELINQLQRKIEKA